MESGVTGVCAAALAIAAARAAAVSTAASRFVSGAALLALVGLRVTLAMIALLERSWQPNYREARCQSQNL